MLKVPAAGEPTPMLVAKKIEKIAPVSLPESFQRARERQAAAGAAGTIPESGESGRKQRRRSGKASGSDQPDWDKEKVERLVRVGGGRSSHVFGWLAGALLSLGIVGAVIFFSRREAPLEPIAIAPVQEEAVKINESVPEPIELPAEMSRNESDLTKELEPLAKAFLEADTVEKMLPLVREPGRLDERIRSYYPGGKVSAPGMSAFNTSGTIAYRGKLASVSVRTGDFAERQIAFVRSVGGMKIDWESFVGWSEMPWKQFIEGKVTRPVLFRASLKLLDYYNFSFADENRWQCYELRSPNGEHVLYGYVQKESLLDSRLRPMEATSSRMVTLKLRFPTEDSSKNQVIIDSMIADGWLEGLDQ